MASDPGLNRLHSAAVTVVTLAVSLGVLYGLTTLAGQTFTVALLGVVISMISAMAFRDDRPSRRLLSAAAMLATASGMVALGAVLAPHKVVGDVVFVAIMTAATAGRRFGQQATTAGMAGFMTYFFALFLGATVSLLPWLIGALAIGTGVSLVMSLLLRVPPRVQVRRTLRAVGSRIALVLDVVIDSLATGNFDQHQRRRLRSRVEQVNEATLMADAQLPSRDMERPLPHGDDEDDIPALELFDVELATENVARSWARIATTGPDRGEAPSALTDALRTLCFGLRHADPDRLLARAELLAEEVWAESTAPEPYRGLALATAGLSRAARYAEGPAGEPHPPREPPDDRAPGANATAVGASAPPVAGSRLQRLSPSTRQAIQVAVASSAAIVAGEQLSAARWYWAVIATFTIYSGTSTRGETFIKGAQRIVGTVAGVAVGAVVASLVGGNLALSLALIFVSLFCGLYLMQVSYAFMVVGMTTMLALLYGLLGEFSLSLLATRIEETALGAVIGVAAAMLVVPASTRAAVREQLRSVYQQLQELISQVGRRLAGESDDELTPLGRELDRRLAALRTAAKPLTGRITGLRAAGTVSHLLTVLLACDHYARILTRSAHVTRDPAVREPLRCATAAISSTLDLLANSGDHGDIDDLQTAEEALHEAQTAIDRSTAPAEQRRALSTTIRSLRQIDLAITGLARQRHRHVPD